MLQEDGNFSFFVFDILHQKHLSSTQPLKLGSKIISTAALAILAGTIWYALVVTKSTISISTDGQRHFDFF